jgi:hypothetical protein
MSTDRLDGCGGLRCDAPSGFIPGGLHRLRGCGFVESERDAAAAKAEAEAEADKNCSWQVFGHGSNFVSI